MWEWREGILWLWCEGGQRWDSLGNKKIRQKRRNVVMVKMMKDESKCEEDVGGKGCSMPRGGEEWATGDMMWAHLRQEWETIEFSSTWQKRVVQRENVMMSFLFTVELHKCAACLVNMPSCNIYLWWARSGCIINHHKSNSHQRVVRPHPNKKQGPYWTGVQIIPSGTNIETINQMWGCHRLIHEMHVLNGGKKSMQTRWAC